MNRPAPLTPAPFGPDDPRLTAYALDALDAADRATVEASLAADPALRTVVDETRAAAATLTAALPRDGATLTALQRQAILLQSNARPGGLRRWSAFGIGTAAAAAILLGIGLTGSGGGGRSDGSTFVTFDDVTASRKTPRQDAGATPLVRQFAPTGSPVDRPRLVFPTTLASGPVSPSQPVVPVPELERRVAEIAPTLGDGAQGIGVAGLGTNAPGDDVFFGTPETRDRFAVDPGDVVRLRGLPADKEATVTLGSRTFRVQTRAHGYLLLAGDGDNGVDAGAYYLPDGSNEAYATVPESGFLRVADARLSTFSIDVDTASYANVRRMLTSGQRPPPAAVRLEELVNYFPYEYPAPTGPDPFAVHLEVAECPWDGTHRLVRVGIQGRPLERKARPPMNLVFLVDVSGSMNAPNKLPLVQASLRMLLEELNERDSVAIVVYAGASGLALPPTWCEQKAGIQRAIDALTPGGSTNGAAGIELAYEIATQRFVKDGVNRVVLATDGDFNVGVTSQDALHALITAKAKSGVFLTCLGYGMGNLKDATLELLADKGNGNYGYIDSTREARKVLVDEASGTLVTIAKDVKLQVEFNPATVASYRLIGYDNRRLADRDFADDTKDAGEVGAGHRVTALYEVVPVGAPDAAAVATPGEEPLRYGPAPTSPVVIPGIDVRSLELLTVKVRWKEPAGTESTKREFPLMDGGATYGKASRDFKFAASVAAFGMLLRNSPYAGRITWDAVAEWASEGLPFDPGGYRAEFLDLLARAKSLPR